MSIILHWWLLLFLVVVCGACWGFLGFFLMFFLLLYDNWLVDMFLFCLLVLCCVVLCMFSWFFCWCFFFFFFFFFVVKDVFKVTCSHFLKDILKIWWRKKKDVSFVLMIESGVASSKNAHKNWQVFVRVGLHDNLIITRCCSEFDLMTFYYDLNFLLIKCLTWGLYVKQKINFVALLIVCSIVQGTVKNLLHCNMPADNRMLVWCISNTEYN